MWFHVLEEAEVAGQGECLGPVGSRIVTETVIGQLRADLTSFLNQGWDPSKGVTTDDGQQVADITTFLRFAKTHSLDRPGARLVRWHESVRVPRGLLRTPETPGLRSDGSERPAAIGADLHPSAGHRRPDRR